MGWGRRCSSQEEPPWPWPNVDDRLCALRALGLRGTRSEELGLRAASRDRERVVKSSAVVGLDRDAPDRAVAPSAEEQP
jgi:hypothetical protein